MTEKDKKFDGSRIELFLQLLMDNQKYIYAYILGMTSNFNDADDVMQEATAIMWRKFSDFQEGTDFTAWGGRIAWYRILNLRKKKQKDSCLIFSDEAVRGLQDDSYEGLELITEKLNVLKSCIRKLAERDQVLVRLRYEDEISVKRIAKRFGRSVQSVYQNIARVHDMLLRCVNRSIAEGGEL